MPAAKRPNNKSTPIRPHAWVPSKELMRRYISKFRLAEGDMDKASAALGLRPTQFVHRWRYIKKQLPDEIPYDLVKRGGNKGLSDEEATQTWDFYERYGYNVILAAEAAGINSVTFGSRIRSIQNRFGLQKSSQGYREEKQPEVLALPPKGQVKRYLCTVAQNNTQPDICWGTIKGLAKYWDADIKISTVSYIPASQGSQKRGKEKKIIETWYAPEFEPHLSDEYQQLAPGLLWCGHMNIIPTAASPLAGFESYTGRASGIFPHTKIAMNSISTHKADPTKFNYTTGAVTKRNYIQKSMGLKAEFHHSYGALLVEVTSTGHWWCRQLNADSKGRIYDKGLRAFPDGTVETWDKSKKSFVEAIGWGDIHEEGMDPVVETLAWGKGGMLDTLRPNKQFVADVLDMRRRGHHTRKDPHELYKMWVHGRESILGEVQGCARFFGVIDRPWCNTYVKNSNHHNALHRYLKEVDWRDDLPNAEFYLDAQGAMLRAIRENTVFDAFEWAVKRVGIPKDIRFLGEDESFIICKDGSGGIECGMHGDLGAGGRPGSPRQFAKMGRKSNTEHTHVTGIIDGNYCAGHACLRDQGYNRGLGAWSQSHVVTYANGKRAIYTMFDGAYCADNWVEQNS